MSEQRGGGDELPPLDALDEIVARIAFRFRVILAVDTAFEELEEHRDDVIALALDAEQAIDVFAAWVGLPHDVFGCLDERGPLALFLTADIADGVSGQYIGTDAGVLVAVDIRSGALGHELAHYIDRAGGGDAPWSFGPDWRKALSLMPKTVMAADLRDTLEGRIYHATPDELFAEALANGCRLATGERLLLADDGLMPPHQDELEDALNAIELKLLVPLRARAQRILGDFGEPPDHVKALPIYLTVPPPLFRR